MSVAIGAIQGTLTMAAPLLLASLGETVLQRSGVVNVGIEGMILTGALAAVLGSQYTHSAMAGIGTAAIAGILVAVVFLVFAIRLAANQVVVGVVINLMALGITGTVSRAVFGNQHTFVTVPGLPHLIANQSILSILAIVAVPLVSYWIYHTRAGLELRAVGEQPSAAAASGSDVIRIRSLAAIACGAMAGIAGACITVGDVPTFQENMSGGRGFIALAIVTSGRWNPYGCLAAALIFGAAEELEIQGQAMGLHLPHDILLALPYVVTLVILAAGARSGKSPASLGLPYRKS